MESYLDAKQDLNTDTNGDSTPALPLQECVRHNSVKCEENVQDNAKRICNVRTSDVRTSDKASPKGDCNKYTYSRFIY